MFQGETKLTMTADGEEPGLLHNKGGGRLRGGIGQGEGGEAPHTRNRAMTHRRRQIAAAMELQAAATMEMRRCEG